MAEISTEPSPEESPVPEPAAAEEESLDAAVLVPHPGRTPGRIALIAALAAIGLGIILVVPAFVSQLGDGLDSGPSIGIATALAGLLWWVSSGMQQAPLLYLASTGSLAAASSMVLDLLWPQQSWDNALAPLAVAGALAVIRPRFVWPRLRAIAITLALTVAAVAAWLSGSPGWFAAGGLALLGISGWTLRKAFQDRSPGLAVAALWMLLVLAMPNVVLVGAVRTGSEGLRLMWLLFLLVPVVLLGLTGWAKRSANLGG